MASWICGLLLKPMTHSNIIRQRFFINILILLPAILGLSTIPAMAADEDAVTSQSDQEQIIKPELDRREIVVPAIDTEDFEVGAYTGVMSVEDFGANTVTGFRFAYHVTESAFFEAAYGTTDTEKTSYERLSGATQLLTADERKLTYYNISIGYNLLPGESFIGTGRAFNSTLYVIAGVGSTDFGGDNRFTMNFGAGYRLLGTDWLAFHADVRDHIFKNDLLGTEKTSHNIEIHGGVTFFF